MIADEYFARFSTPKYRSSNPLQRRLIRRFVDQVHSLFLEAQPAQTVLEVGIGEGFLSGYLSEKFPEKQFTGVDLSARDLALLGEKFPRIVTRELSIYDLSQLGSVFDLVLCAEVLEHVEDPARAVDALASVCRGHAIVTVPHEPWFLLGNLARGKNLSRLGNDPEHIQFFGRKKLRATLARRFDVLRMTSSTPWLLALGRPKAG